MRRDAPMLNFTESWMDENKKTLRLKSCYAMLSTLNPSDIFFSQN